MLARRSSALSRSRPGEVDEGSERLKERRRKVRRRVRILFGMLLAVLLGAFVWLTWQPQVRISHIEVSNADPAVLTIAKNKLAGTYLGITPRNSFFFVPEHAIRVAIIEADSGIQAVSISRTSVTSLTISLHERVPIARWCGSTDSRHSPQASSPQVAPTPTDGEYCYLFDADGYLYAAADTATTTAPLNSFAVYAPLVGDTLEPLRATLVHAKQLPNLFDFARKVGEFGSPVVTITLRGDEADLLLQSSTRLTYVIGSEEETFSNLMSAKANLRLSDGSLLYVDLRFPGKVYLKKKSAVGSEQ